MPGKAVKIGPFDKGLNNISQAGESKDNEVVSLVNFEVALDSSLTARPPMEIVSGSLQANTITDLYQVFGIYRVSTTEWYTVVQKMTSPGNWTLEIQLNGDPTNTRITVATFTNASNKVTAYVQWNDTLYFSVGPNATIQGFSWKKGGTVTSLTTMPPMTVMVAHKGRLWGVDTTTAINANTVFFSKVDANGSHPDTWNSGYGGTTNTDNIVVDPGAGGYITALLPLNNSLLVFKSDATYRFAFPTDPKNGQVDKLSDYIGCANQYSAVNYENYVYIYHQGRVYELINNIFIQINKLVLFAVDNDNACVDGTAPSVSMSVMSRRIIIQFNNTLYVYSIDTKAWSQWRSYCGTPGRFFELPADPASANPLVYIAASQGTIQNPSTSYIDSDFTSNQAYLQSNVGTGYTVATSGNLITVTKQDSVANETATVFLNDSGNTSNYNIAVAAGLRYKFSTTLSISTGTAYARMTYLLRNGGTSTTDIALASGSNNVTFTVPDQAIKAYCTVYCSTLTTMNQSFSLTAPSLVRSNDASPITLIKITDHHIVTSQAVELIECSVRTKSYDYDTPANYKRLFWWGIDCVTKQDINTKTIPIAKAQPILWGDLQAYTHAQLASGTWGNPLSWRNTTLTVIDVDSLANSTTENGRVLAKNLKSLIFRQISFQISMTCLGNNATGPCKIFGLVTYAIPREKESAKVS